MGESILIANQVVYNKDLEKTTEKDKLNSMDTLMETESTSSNQLSTPFTSLDSLRKETERSQTFIDWPLDFIHPSELVRWGFYYLRTSDHVACIFCRGIVGAWEKGDAPLTEHMKHFPHCPLVQGRYCGNITALESSSSCESEPMINIREVHNVGIDHCLRKADEYECSRVKGKAINFDELGLPQYNGPRQREFITYENRLKSFIKWPERVKQTPHELAEAGFFSNGISDHVICFHCGNGIRNWQSDAVPMVEHIRHYPQCSFVMFKSQKATSRKVTIPVPEEEGEPLKNKENIIQDNTIHSTECGEKLEDCRLCKICLDTELEVVFLPCAHMATCASCALTQTNCPICRAEIRHIIKPIMS